MAANEDVFINQQNQTRQDYEEIEHVRKTPLVRKVLFSSTVRGLAIVAIFAAVIPFIIYYLVIDLGDFKEPPPYTCSVNKDYLISCGNPNVTEEICASIKCCYDNNTQSCYHYLPSRYYYFKSGDKFVPSLEKTPFKNEALKEVALTVSESDENRLSIILHDPKISVENKKVEGEKSYNYTLYDKENLAIEVYRLGTNDLLLSTTKGPLIASENYWEWSFHLGNQYLFGLGDAALEMEDEEEASMTTVIYSNRFEHNALPIFMGYVNGSFHGLIVRHTGPLEVTVLRSKLVSLKSILGSRIELELSLGPTPKDVISQQRDFTFGSPPSWVLGPHICRGGTTKNLQAILDEYDQFLATNADLTYASDCIHENLWTAMFSMDDTQKERLLATIANLEASNKKFVLSLPPQLPVDSDLFKATTDLSIFYQDKSKPYEGQYLGSNVVYPYFGHSSIDSYVVSLLSDIQNKLQFVPSNLFLSDNWPAEDTFEMEQPKDFPYMSEALLEAFSYTLPWNTIAEGTSHMTQHNDYGALQVTTVADHLDQMATDDIFVMSSSHNLATASSALVVQNIDTSWAGLRKAISSVLYNSLFGNPLTSVPVCGSSNAYDPVLHESLCMRWYLMAATAPVFRISSDLPRRDPNSLGSKFAVNTAKKAISIRSELQFYLSTVLAKGEPLMRPMFYDFPGDNETFRLTEQYMVGGNLLVVHPVLPDKSGLRVYLPKSVGVWYEYFAGSTYGGGWTDISIVETDWTAFIPEARIVPQRMVSQEGSEGLRLVVALSCKDSTCTASGEMSFGSSTELIFEATDSKITITGVTDDAKAELGCPDKSFLLDRASVFKSDHTTTVIPAESVNLCDAADGQVTIDITW